NDLVLDRVARSAGNIGDDGPFLVEQNVEQRGFAGIGFSGNDRGDPVLDDVTLVKRTNEGIQELLNFFDQPSQIIAFGKFHVLLAKIQFQFHQRGKVDQFFAEVLD